jgi:hypothetical protein
MPTGEPLYIHSVEIGDEVTPQVTSISMERVIAFWGASPRSEMLDQPNRFNSEAQAKKEGLAGPVVPGPMCMALIAKVLTDWSEGVRLKVLDVILRQVWPQASEVKIYGVVTDKNDDLKQVEVDIYVEDPGGQPLIRGKAVLGLPTKPT